MATIVAAPSSQGEIWRGDFDPAAGPITINGNIQFPNPPSFAGSPADITIYTAATSPDGPPPPGLKYFARFILNDSDIPVGSHGRTQLVSPFFAQTSQAPRLSFWFRMHNVPPVPSGSGKFFNLYEFYGPPYASSPQVSLTVDSNGNLAFASQQQALSPYYFNGMWTTPLAPLVGVWLHSSMVVNCATSNAGYTEFSIATDGTDNDVLQSLTLNGSTLTQMPMQTMNYAATSRCTHMAMYPQIYRTQGIETQSVIDFAGFRADTLS